MGDSADTNRLPDREASEDTGSPGTRPSPPTSPIAPLDAHADIAAGDLFEVATRKLVAPRLPVATYRVQMNRDFTFCDASAQADYFALLGVSELYTSPFFKARRDSPHGYDLVDHSSLHPAIGTREDLDRLTDDLAERGMGLLLDFVPNHMGIGSENAWWMDVLENGPSSLYAPFFDIDWAPLKSELGNKVLLPILGDHYGRVLESGNLRLEIEQGAFFLRYFDTTLPVNPRTYEMILEPMLPGLLARLGEEHDAALELQSILTGLRHLPPRTETHRAKVIERRREKEILKRRLAAAIEVAPEISEALAARLAAMNGAKGDPKSFDALDRLLEEQAYRLSFWRVAAEEINYRRFFDVNDLAAIRMENPAVFEAAHRLVLALIGEGRVTGLRIDHPDGLWDPVGYFSSIQRAVFLERCRHHAASGTGSSAALRPAVEAELRSLFSRAGAADPGSPVARPLYMVVEKILARGETLPEDWPVHGTSGYDFTNLVGGLFVDPESELPMSEAYERFTGIHADFDLLVYQKKKQVLQTAMASELNVLAHALNRLSERDRYSRDFTLGTLTDALREVIASFPIYRTYATERTQTIGEHDRMAVARAIRLATRRNPMIDGSVYAFLRSILMLEVPASAPEDQRPMWREFVMRFQQLTGPVTAKGLEDTAFYNYNRLISLNEVGGEPERYGTSITAFHRANAERQRLWPHSLLATSTHDTKRSEDVRARISVIAELWRAWEAAARGLAGAAAKYKTDLDGQLAPDRNEEYLLYQTIVGTLPPRLLQKGEIASVSNAISARTDYIDRIVAYMRKATKEAKANTSCINASPEYDAAVEAFVRGVLGEGGPLEEHLGPIARAAAFHGMWGSLSQVLLKLTSRGVPDIYQGNEMWDDSLVDPDNRRRVDYDVRTAALADLRARMGMETSAGTGVRDGERPTLARELVRTAEDGRIKLFVTHVALRTRQRLPGLFGAQGAYAPLDAAGRAAPHVVAFARRAGDREIVVVAPRLLAKLCEGRLEPPVGAAFEDTRLPVAEGRFTSLFTGTVEATEERDGISYLPLDRVLADLPVALLERVSLAE